MGWFSLTANLFLFALTNCVVTFLFVVHILFIAYIYPLLFKTMTCVKSILRFKEEEPQEGFGLILCERIEEGTIRGKRFVTTGTHLSVIRTDAGDMMLPTVELTKVRVSLDFLFCCDVAHPVCTIFNLCRRIYKSYQRQSYATSLFLMSIYLVCIRLSLFTKA
jgi:hypothetical protein